MNLQCTSSFKPKLEERTPTAVFRYNLGLQQVVVEVETLPGQELKPNPSRADGESGIDTTRHWGENKHGKQFSAK